MGASAVAKDEAGTEEDNNDSEDVPTNNKVDKEDNDDYDNDEEVAPGINHRDSHMYINHRHTHYHTLCGSLPTTAVASSLCNCCTTERKDRTTSAQPSAIRPRRDAFLLFIY